MRLKFCTFHRRRVHYIQSKPIPLLLAPSYPEEETLRLHCYNRCFQILTWDLCLLLTNLGLIWYLQTPSGNVEAKVMCFFRRRDLPPSLTFLADRHQSKLA